MAIGATGATGAVANTPVFTNTAEFNQVIEALAVVEMVSTSVALTGTLTATWRWVDRLGRSRAVTSSALSVLNANNRVEHRVLAAIGAGETLSFEIDSLNIGVGAFSFDYLAGVISAIDTLPPGQG